MRDIISKALKNISRFILRYGLGIVLIWLGFLKFKDSEAEYTHQLISGGYLSWILKYVLPSALNHIIAYMQIITGLLVMLKLISRKLAFWGGVIALLIFVFSLSMLVSSQVVWQSGYGFPELSLLGQVILKDLILLGAAAWCVGDSI